MKFVILEWICISKSTGVQDEREQLLRRSNIANDRVSFGKSTVY
jgi:hypothetical protein